MPTTYLPHVKLASIAAGQAEVRWFTPHSSRVPFGTSEGIGWVVKTITGRWLAQDADGVPLEAFPTRQAAINHLVARR